MSEKPVLSKFVTFEDWQRALIVWQADRIADLERLLAEANAREAKDYAELLDEFNSVKVQNAKLVNQLAASADKTAATVQPNLSAPNGIPATPMHDAGAIAQCGYCRRYTLDQKALFDERYQPICDCGKKHGWSGSFTAPTPEAKWHGAAPQPQPKESNDLRML